MREGARLGAARRLRGELTEAERALWRLLRAKRFDGVKFKRQVPIGPYVADFACVGARVIVELDGSQHADSAHDLKRDAYLAANGWKVVRFWNNDLTQNREGVLTAIAVALGRL